MVTKILLNDKEYDALINAMENSLAEDGWDSEESEDFDDLVLSCAKAIDAALATMDIQLVWDNGEDKPEEEFEEEEEEEENVIDPEILMKNPSEFIYELDGTKVISETVADTILAFIKELVENMLNGADEDEQKETVGIIFTNWCKENGIEGVERGE